MDNSHGDWWSGVVVSALASINEVNLRRARLVLRWATVFRFNSQCWIFILVCNQPAFHPSGIGKWVPALAGKAKAGMVHSVSRWMQGVQVKLWDPLRMRVIPECLRGVFTTRCYINPHLPLPLPLLENISVRNQLYTAHIVVAKKSQLCPHFFIKSSTPSECAK